MCIKEEIVIYTLEDLTRLNWQLNTTATNTGGSLLKAVEGRRYYKLSTLSSYITGHESVNEIIVDRLLSQIGIPHVSYTGHNALIKVDGNLFTTFLCSSEDFKNLGESKIPLDLYYAINKKESESPESFMIRLGYQTYLNQLLFVDYLIVNRDRHGANLEVLTKAANLRLSPLFDHGLSFVGPYQNDLERIKDFDPLTDVQANNFFGTHSLESNLRLITSPVILQTDVINFTELFRDLEPFITAVHTSKITDIINARLHYAKQKNLYICAAGKTSCFS